MKDLHVYETPEGLVIASLDSNGSVILRSARTGQAIARTRADARMPWDEWEILIRSELSDLGLDPQPLIDAIAAVQPLRAPSLDQRLAARALDRTHDQILSPEDDYPRFRCYPEPLSHEKTAGKAQASKAFDRGARLGWLAAQARGRTHNLDFDAWLESIADLKSASIGTDE